MKRSALKRHTYLQHGKPLKQTSDHRRREDRERAPILKALREGQIGRASCRERVSSPV